MSSYTVTAYQRGKETRTLQLVAVSPTIAVRTAMELMPGWLISSPRSTPEWSDDVPTA